MDTTASMAVAEDSSEPMLYEMVDISAGDDDTVVYSVDYSTEFVLVSLLLLIVCEFFCQQNGDKIVL